MAMFNSYVKLPEGISFLYIQFYSHDIPMMVGFSSIF
jgi:hypothetical protein